VLIAQQSFSEMKMSSTLGGEVSAFDALLLARDKELYPPKDRSSLPYLSSSGKGFPKSAMLDD
jgi:hypothetical protein